MSASNKRSRILWITGGLFVVIGFVALLFWLFVGQFYIYTDDAYVGGNTVMITPEVSGGVVSILADESDFVEEGQVLVEIDKNDFVLSVEEKKMTLANTVRNIAALFENVKEKQALVEVRRSEMKQKGLDLAHRVGLSETGAISIEEFEIANTAYNVSQAYLTFAQEELNAALALVENTTIATHPMVLEAAYQLKEAYLNLIRCDVVAPATGYIAKRSVQVGDFARAGDTLLFVVPLDQIWVDANYKETQLRKVRNNQRVTFTADMYGKSLEYHGRVVGLTPGTGAAFALLPPQNASGNWIKIIQRLPVRICVDPEEIKKHPLFIGLSVRMYVDLHDQTGPRLTEVARIQPRYATSMYTCQKVQMDKIDELICQIIYENSPLQKDEKAQ